MIEFKTVTTTIGSRSTFDIKVSKLLNDGWYINKLVVTDNSWLVAFMVKGI